MVSDAVGLDRVSRIIGYKLTGGDFSETSPNLPQRIAVLAEANDTNQGTLILTPQIVTSAQQAGKLYGYGSPIYNIVRILKPVFGDGVGGIPVVIYPQAVAGSAVAKVLTLTPTGTSTGNATHTLIIAGRRGVDSLFYDFNIVTGDTPTIISGKIRDAVNAVLGSPVIGTGTLTAVMTSKWAGLTSDALTISVDTNGKDIGVTYAVVSTTSGSGTPSVQPALDQFKNEWNTIVVNSYGTVGTVMNALEAFNGKPDPINPSGRYNSIVMKPFIAITGTVADDPTAITDPRAGELTIALAPAPGSKGLPMEAAANVALLYAIQSQNSPHLDITGKYGSYPDMPTPVTIGSMGDYNNRDLFVKKGSSTVDLVAGRYVMQDFVTTYHPIGETPPQFRFVRNINIDMNIRYGYYLLEQLYVVDHVISKDEDTVLADNVVKPKTWKQQIDKYAEDLTLRALTVEKSFMQNSIVVGIGTSNPDRLETFFKYKRSGYARIASTTAQAGFNFGTLN